MNIFLSHSHTDKPVIEPIAMGLRDVFGQESVFYDSWSIQPGDGIIEKMNEGLATPDFVFFFVSVASLQSKMVEVEWQNALFASTKGKVKIVPVRVDGAAMPPVLMQKVWIDLFSQGPDAAIQQIVGLVQGMNTFVPQHQGFSNLTYFLQSTGPDAASLHVKASHLMEPSARFAVIADNDEDDMFVALREGMYTAEFRKEFLKSPNGQTLNGFIVGRMIGPLTPQHPLTVDIGRINSNSKPIRLFDLLHEQKQNAWVTVPQRQTM